MINDTLAARSTIGKNSGMMIIVKQLAIIVYTVMVAMLPPSFSVTTAAAAAVGQMTMTNIPSHTILTSGDVRFTMTRTMSADSVVRTA